MRTSKRFQKFLELAGHHSFAAPFGLSEGLQGRVAIEIERPETVGEFVADIAEFCFRNGRELTAKEQVEFVEHLSHMRIETGYQNAKFLVFEYLAFDGTTDA